MIAWLSLGRPDGPGSDMLDIPPQGSIADIFFPRLVAQLHRDGFEGLVRVALGDTTKILYFKGGEIATAASNAEADRLASILIQEGRLTQAQMEMAASRLEPGASLGKMLIEMGFLSPSELLQGARRQVRQILASCCTLSSGTYHVEPGPLPPQVTVLGLPTRRMVVDAVLQAKDRQWVVREMGSMETVYGPTASMHEGLNDLKLDIAIDQVARMIDGSQSLRDLSGRTSLDDFTVSKLAVALEALGMAERVGEPVDAGIGVEAARMIPIGSGEAQAAAEAVVADQDEVSASPPMQEAQGPPDEPYLPAIPEEELPAFAVTEDEGTRWEIDPKTGERVHHGPIELTFEGRVGGPGKDRRILTWILAGTGALAVVVVAAILFWPRHGPVTTARQESLPRQKAARPEVSGTAGSSTGSTPPAAQPGPSASRPRAAVAGTEAPGARPQVATPAAKPAAPETKAEPRKPTAPETKPGAPERKPAVPRATPSGPELAAAPGAAEIPVPRGSISPFSDAARYGSALRRFDAGDPAGAARVFQDLALAEDPGRFTLQLMIACETETLQNARARSGEQGSLYFLPFALKDRGCYRVCWGIYESKKTAGSAIGGLPRSLAGEGVRPIVVSLARLKPRPS